MKTSSFLNAAALLLFSSATVARAGGATDKLTPAAPGSVQIHGWLGERMQASLDHRVMPQDVPRIIQPFRDRHEENGGHWRCEYWGKWITSDPRLPLRADARAPRGD